MFRRHYSLILMALWLGVATALLAPEAVLPEKARGQIGGLGGSMTGMLALAFAAYNLVRWWATRHVVSVRPRPNPLARRGDDEPYVPNPELDFLRPPDAERER
ncbi:hypothetical protein [Urbifossiella limnaea]|uniref:Uncharacterized protein n=1 Tax=Urbifossiella limnaea TaxID=2528023 RepID=A0A517XSJ9_9BACT|nr:hypothetical protein [Urbifossiella limnaea]QDU20478.1 hypothetical protein ETAA1_24300 [Urbifossiella limnaea]